MFYCCSSLTSLNISNFDTSQVNYMRDMFSGCSQLSSLNLSNFNTSRVTNMEYIFYENFAIYKVFFYFILKGKNKNI